MVIEKDLGWGRIVFDLNKIDNSYTKIGFPENAKPGNVTQRVKGIEISTSLTEIAIIAAFNEYGTARATSSRSGGQLLDIPARPFMSTSFDENVNELQNIKSELLGQIIDGKLSVERALALVGEYMTSKTKKKILDIRFPANAPETIRKKKSDNPLIATSQMINTVTHTEIIK